MKNEYNLVKEIHRLKTIRGSGTELITIYVPAGYVLSDEVARLREEHSQSGNIKSKSTRTNVQGAIEKIIQYLKLFKSTPKNGLVVFCGNISDNQSKTNIELFSMEPPQPLNINIYRCDSTFLLEPIEEMVETKDVYVLLAMDGREATIATLKGHYIHVIKRINSSAHAKVRKGGQSAQRYQRAIEESIDDYYKSIGDVIDTVFEQAKFQYKGLIVGGPGPAKEGFVKAKTTNYQVKVLGVYDTGYTDETGLNEILDKAEDLLKEQEAAQERVVLEHFIKEIVRNGLAVYGYDNTLKALQASQVSKLILNQDLDMRIIEYKCNSCGKEFERFEQGRVREQKHECGGTLSVTGDKDAIEGLIELADNTGVETVFVSSESSYGKEFLMGFKGIGAMLRYK